jgi:hypothetical protein
MKYSYYYYVFILLLIWSCSKDNNNPTVPVLPDDTDDTSQDTTAVSTIHLLSFNTLITSPAQNRDYSFHNEGTYGIFEHPDSTKSFQGQVAFIYADSSATITPEDIQLTWRTNLDGVLFEGHPDEEFKKDIQTLLSKGIHTLYLEAEVIDHNYMAKDSIILSNVINLSASKTGHSIQLDWSKYEGNDFESYVIYREDFNPITEITDINQLTYEDLTMPSLTDEFQYQVVVNTSNTYDHVVGSGIIHQNAGNFVLFPYFIQKMIRDPFRSKIYAICRPLSIYDDADKYGILIIDYQGDTVEITDHILQDERIEDFDMSADGQYLFLCQRRIEKITRLDLTTMDTDFFPTDTNEWGIHKIEVGNNNILYCHRDPPTSGSTSFWVYDGNTGDYINGPTGTSRHGDMEFSRTHNKLYTGLSNTSGGHIYRQSVNGNIIDVDLIFPVWPETVSYPTPFVLLSEDDQHLFWEHYELNNNFTVVRTFDTHIIGCSPNNVYLSDKQGVYEYNTLQPVRQFPESPDSYRTSMVFPNEQTLIFSQAYSENGGSYEYTYFFKVNLD